MSQAPSQHSAASASTIADTAAGEPLPVRVLWTVAEGLDSAAIARLTAELPAMERDQARRFYFAADRATYVAAHAMLRRALRERLGGAEPLIVRNELGRPELAPRPGAGPPLSFNLTHSRGFAACAFREEAAVGIDAEDIRRPINVAEVAARWFTISERLLLDGLPESYRVAMFFRIWTLKEAMLKTTGHGLRVDTRRFAVDPDRGEAAVSEGLGIPTRWRLAELVPLPYIRLAVAVPGNGALAPSTRRIVLG